MEPKFEELKKENPEEAQEYFDFIKSSVADGSYFKDALDWYMFRYVTPFCERTILVFASILTAVVMFFLVEMIKQAFPLVEEIPIVIRSFDQSRYFPDLVELKSKKGMNGVISSSSDSVDEAVARYLLGSYVKNRENFDFSEAEIQDVNDMFGRIKNVSSLPVYKDFQLFMSKDNPESPINQFGLNVSKKVEIESINFIKQEQKRDFAQMAKNFITVKIPTEAEVRFVATTITKDDNMIVIKQEKVQYLAKINFSFGGINKDRKEGVLDFMVNGYKLYKVEK